MKLLVSTPEFRGLMLSLFKLLLGNCTGVLSHYSQGHHRSMLESILRTRHTLRSMFGHGLEHCLVFARQYASLDRGWVSA